MEQLLEILFRMELGYWWRATRCPLFFAKSINLSLASTKNVGRSAVGRSILQLPHENRFQQKLVEQQWRPATDASCGFCRAQPRDATIHHPRPVESVLERPDVKTAGEILATPFNNLRFKTLSTGQIARRLAVCEESSTTPFGRFVRFTRKL